MCVSLPLRVLRGESPVKRAMRLQPVVTVKTAPPMLCTSLQAVGIAELSLNAGPGGLAGALAQVKVIVEDKRH